jgi:MHS family proline/betaine transporter-like MFS transporter
MNNQCISYLFFDSMTQPLSTSGHSPAISSKKLRHVVISCMIGNALEWYDFALYGYFGVMISRLMFPPDQTPVGLLLKSYAVFFLGFIMRPLGAVLFGYIGDRHGRKKALMWSIYCMAIPTTLIGLLPTYEQVGAWSAVVLIVLRLFQGLSMGGEFTGSMIFVVEHAPEGKKGLWGSWSSLSVLIGLLLGSVLGMLIDGVLTPDQVKLWGWRLPFLFSFAGSWVGSALRKLTDDPDQAKDDEKEHNVAPKKSMFLGRLFAHYWKDMLRVVVIDVVVAVGFFLVTIYVMTYVEQHGQVGYHFSANTLSMLAFACGIPVSGWLSDRWGSITVMQRSIFLLCLISLPCFWGLSSATFGVVLLSHCALSAVMGCIFGPVPSLMVSIFPRQVRYSGVSIAHNISMAIFGGSAPEVAIYLIDRTSITLMPGVFLAVAGIISWCGLANLRRSRMGEMA